MAIIERIKYDGPVDGTSWLVHKYSSDKFVLGSQLIVNQGQEALFFKGGEALDLFGPGTHTLKTGNLPLLNKLVNLPFGGETPFAAEIYYVNKTSELSMKWGTANPIPFEDPKYGLLLSVRAHGQYGITINDIRLFVSRIIGAIPNGTTADYVVVSKYFNGLINTKIKDITAKYMIRRQISFLEITAYLNELSTEYKGAIDEEFERFGIEVINFFVETISPPKEEYEKLREYKEELALGVGFYDKRRSFDVLDKLADNPGAGEMATAGMGLGMGLGAAEAAGNAFGNLMNHLNANAQVSVPVMNTRTCPSCHTNVPANLKFCSECGRKMTSEVKCPFCGAAVLINMKFCGECGRSVGNTRCPDCGTENPLGIKFCGNCGRKIGGE